MEIKRATNKAGHPYKEVNGTWYDAETPDECIRVLERVRESGERVRIFYGTEGRDWGEEYDTIGRISRSMGPCKVPILIYSVRSLGGPSILDSRIIRIDDANKRTIYAVPGYCPPVYDLDVDYAGGTVAACRDGERIATFRCRDSGHYVQLDDVIQKARRYVAFMRGERWTR